MRMHWACTAPHTRLGRVRIRAAAHAATKNRRHPPAAPGARPTQTRGRLRLAAGGRRARGAAALAHASERELTEGSPGTSAATGHRREIPAVFSSGWLAGMGATPQRRHTGVGSRRSQARLQTTRMHHPHRACSAGVGMAGGANLRRTRAQKAGGAAQRTHAPTSTAQTRGRYHPGEARGSLPRRTNKVSDRCVWRGRGARGASVRVVRRRAPPTHKLCTHACHAAVSNSLCSPWFQLNLGPVPGSRFAKTVRPYLLGAAATGAAGHRWAQGMPQLGPPSHGAHMARAGTLTNVIGGAASVWWGCGLDRRESFQEGSAPASEGIAFAPHPACGAPLLARSVCRAAGGKR